MFYKYAKRSTFLCTAALGAMLVTNPAHSELLTVEKISAAEDDGNKPENVLDKNLDTRWSAYGKNMNLVLELPEITNVETMSIAFYKGDERTAIFDIYTSEDGRNWDRVGTSNIRASGTTNGLQKFNVEKSAKFVRYKGQGNSNNDWNSVTEIELHSDGAPHNNATIVKAVDNGNDGNVAKNVFDKNLATRWSAEGNDRQLVVELSDTTYVEDIYIAFYKGNQRTASFVIDVSENGTQWKRVGQRRKSSGSTDKLQGFAVNETARFIRYVGYGNSENGWNSITEIAVNGDVKLESSPEAETPRPSQKGTSTELNNAFLQETFESYSTGTSRFDDVGEENCKAFPSCGSACPSMPLGVSGDIARTGNRSLRYEFAKGNKIRHGDGYCAFRNETRYDANIPYGSDAWFAWSLYPVYNPSQNIQKYVSSGDSWIAQYKNTGGGNLGGIQIREINGNFEFRTSRNGTFLGNVQYNQWNDIIVHMRYKPGSQNGGVTVWVNGRQTNLSNPPSNQNRGPMDFKVGMYGWEPESKSVHYIDNITIVKGNSSYDAMRGALGR